MFITTLVGSQGVGAPAAGRVIGIDNGYGAKTTITYVSAKQFTDSEVPFPEIVITSAITNRTQGSGGMLSGFRYAYYGADFIFDSALDRYTFPGYSRQITVALLEQPAEWTGGLLGAATITDYWPLTPFSSALSQADRWLRTERVGRVREVLTLRAFADPDPWSLLDVDENNTAVVGATHHEWQGKLYEVAMSPTENVFDCAEMFLPLDYTLSIANNFGSNGIDVCRSHGFAYEQSATSWYGGSPPPSSNNVQTETHAIAIDDFGRVTQRYYAGDVFRSDDDVCVENTFAVPSGTFPRILTALASQTLSNCGTGPKQRVWSAESWIYDGLPSGIVSNGFTTSHFIERHATDDGTLLATVHAFDATYDTASNMTTISTQRDTSTRTVTLDYDAFGLVPTHSKLQATSLLSIDVYASFDPVSLAPVTATDANSTQRGTDWDGFGRQVRSTVTSPGGSLGVFSTVAYLGFEGGDPNGRHVVTTTFSDPVPPANVATAAGRVSTVFLDELGRSLRTEVALGSDYANNVLVVGSRIYDAFGRMKFEADPYPATQDPSTAYGTTYYYMDTGDISCIIRGNGVQPLNGGTNPAAELFPTCFERSFDNHVDTRGVRDAASLLAGSPQQGVVRQTVASALGRPISASIVQNGVPLDYATFTQDRLGQPTSMTRFLDPAGNNPVQWFWRLDSTGQTLQLSAPDSATRYYNYSDWGELIETQWTDGAINRQLVRDYDAMARLVKSEDHANGAPDPETVNTYDYDAGVSLSSQVTPTFVLGRLAHASSPAGEVAFSYDALGRLNAQSFKDSQGGIYVQKSDAHADGRLARLEFDLPDNGYNPEQVKYGYDSAGRLHTMVHADTTGSLTLYDASDIDPLGRVRKALYGANTTYFASYADGGRRLIKEAGIESPTGARRVRFLEFDPLNRELARREISDTAATGPETDVAYDALGRLAGARQTNGPTTLVDWHFRYDALGNLVRLEDLIGTSGAALSYLSSDPDRICRIGYGPGGLGWGGVQRRARRARQHHSPTDPDRAPRDRLLRVGTGQGSC
jgi:YD repeat-containing protein